MYSAIAGGVVPMLAVALAVLLLLVVRRRRRHNDDERSPSAAVVADNGAARVPFTVAPQSTTMNLQQSRKAIKRRLRFRYLLMRLFRS
jgi:MYXO-CTERM domain-containing protein